MLETDTQGYDLKSKTGIQITRLEVPEEINEKTLSLFLKQTKSRLPEYFDKLGVFVDVENIKTSKTFEKDLESIIKTLESNGFIVSGILNPKESQKETIKNTFNVAIFFDTGSNKQAQVNEKDIKIVEKIIEKEIIIEKEVFVEKEILVEKATELESNCELSLKIHTGVVRGGNKIYAKNAHLLIIGSVKPNAEVIADGSIFVLGKLEGKALAGGVNNEDSVILAKEMFPSLISIAGNYQPFEEHSPYYGDNKMLSYTGQSLKSDNF